MNEAVPSPTKIATKDLKDMYPLLNFLVKDDVKKVSREMEISIKAGDIVGELYDALLKQYLDPTSPHTLQSLNVLCVRLVFCLYAEDAGIFGERGLFHDYLAANDVAHLRGALIDLFHVLDQKEDERDPYLPDSLAAFPYVNGGLFANENIEIPQFTPQIRELILEKASEDFDWHEISPTIFGALFESTLNPQTRRSGGMHYTSIENIHKVIDPLFLDELKAEFAQIKAIGELKKKKRALEKFQEKLASLTFLDPAAGSGNFLTETYLCLRRLENECIAARLGGQVTIGDVSNPIQVSINQFYGIEINDFAVTVAKTALWIAESQMMRETEDILYGTQLEFLPLKTNANIVEANALRLDWNEVIAADELDYIMGNPPFVGARLMSVEQKDDLNNIFAGWKNVGNLDYVCAWYKKAADFIADTNVRVALVSTNSVSQGESVGNLWKPLFDEGIHIDFAYRTFVWDSEANAKAHVHCVIIGFSIAPFDKQKVIYDAKEKIEVDHINAYLIDGPDYFIESRTTPLCDVPKIGIGNKPVDGGFYLFTQDEMEDFIKKEPESQPYFLKCFGSKEFINRSPRYCLWLGDCSPTQLRSMPECMKRVQAVRDFRLQSPSAGTRKLADSPTRFHVENMPHTTSILIPKTSSERRRYIPIGFLDEESISTDANFIIPGGTIFHFGVLTSNVHMAWTRTVCGRLKSDYRYSKDIVYNNFPWPEPTQTQRQRIEETARAILNARALYPTSSLADLYDPLTMPQELRAAHTANDRAVMAAYGFSTSMSEADCVAALMKLYQQLTS